MARILIADDCEYITRTLADLLEDSGWDIDVATNGEEAVRMAASKMPDLIILDIAMPVMSGLDAAGLLKRAPATRHIPIMMATSWKDPESIASARAVGVAHYLVKPFDLRDLLARVTKLLEDKQ